MSLRKRIGKSDRTARALTWLLTGYMRFIRLTGRWKGVGIEELLSELENGPVIIICWHQHLVLAPLVWPKDPPNGVVPHDTSPAGKLSAHTQLRLGIQPVAMKPTNSAMANMRLIMREVRAGKSLGLTADGPKGPPYEAKAAVVAWARATKRPVFLFAYSARPVFKLKSWDRMMLPLPLSRASYGYRRWSHEISGKTNPADLQIVLDGLGAELDQLTAEMDLQLGS